LKFAFKHTIIDLTKDKLSEVFSRPLSNEWYQLAERKLPWKCINRHCRRWNSFCILKLLGNMETEAEYLGRHTLDLPASAVNELFVARDRITIRDTMIEIEEVNFPLKWDYTPRDFQPSVHTVGMSPMWVRAMP
jgi:hypothetical protein